MSEKRRDTKGRVLQDGELQRKDGKYEFRYTDACGNRKSVYSWRLVKTDKLPAGKRDCEPLRDLKKKIEQDLHEDIRTATASGTTLNDYFQGYMKSKVELKASTRSNYKYMYGKYVADTLGKKAIGSIRYSDIRAFYIHLVADIGFKPNSMDIIHTILHPIFNLAVRDFIIRINPTDGAMDEIKRSYGWEKPKRHALTKKEQEVFINYVKNSRVHRKWLPLFTFMLGTGCRIGETVGLCWRDCDFKNGVISINHNLVCRRPEDGGPQVRYISTPKTKAGVRIIPMLTEVREALLEQQIRNPEGSNNIVIDGYYGFIFINRVGNVMTPQDVNKTLYRIIDAYNAEEMLMAEKENREPFLLPKFSSHTLRHTFCTRYCEIERNLKTIQEIMGHADISTTMNIYNEATREEKERSFMALEGKFKIS